MILCRNIGEIRKCDGELGSGGLLQADSMTRRVPPQDGPSCPVDMGDMRTEPGVTQNDRDDFRIWKLIVRALVRIGYRC